MSSLVRRIACNRRRRAPEYTAPAQQYVENPDGSMSILHPTKGWRRVSFKRRQA
jgi:hypothetical protein